MDPNSWAAYSQYRLGTSVNPNSNDPMVGGFTTNAPPILLPHHAHQSDQNSFVNANILAHSGFDPISYQAAAVAAAQASKNHLVAAAAAQSNIFKAVSSSKDNELRENFARVAANAAAANVMFSTTTPHPAHSSWRHGLMSAPTAPSPFGVLPHESAITTKADDRPLPSYRNTLPQDNLGLFQSNRLSHNFVGGQGHFTGLEKSVQVSSAQGFQSTANPFQAFVTLPISTQSLPQAHIDLTSRFGCSVTSAQDPAPTYSSVITRVSAANYQDPPKKQQPQQQAQYSAQPPKQIQRASPAPISPYSSSGSKTPQNSGSKNSVPSPQMNSPVGNILNMRQPPSQLPPQLNSINQRQNQQVSSNRIDQGRQVQSNAQIHQQQQQSLQNSPQTLHFGIQDTPQQILQRNPPPAHQSAPLAVQPNQLIHNLQPPPSSRQNAAPPQEQPVYETLQKASYISLQTPQRYQPMSKAELQALAQTAQVGIPRHLNISPAKTSFVDESLFNGLEELASAASLSGLPSKDIADSIPSVVEGSDYGMSDEPAQKRRKSANPKRKEPPRSPPVLHQMQAPPAAHAKPQQSTVDPRSLLPVVGHLGQLVGSGLLSNSAMQAMPLMMQSVGYGDPYLIGSHDQFGHNGMNSHHSMEQEPPPAPSPKKKQSGPSIEDDLGFLAELPAACNVTSQKKPTPPSMPALVAVKEESTNKPQQRAGNSGYLDMFIQFAQGKPPQTLESASAGPAKRPVKPYIPPPPRPTQQSQSPGSRIDNNDRGRGSVEEGGLKADRNNAQVVRKPQVNRGKPMPAGPMNWSDDDERSGDMSRDDALAAHLEAQQGAPRREMSMRSCKKKTIENVQKLTGEVVVKPVKARNFLGGSDSDDQMEVPPELEDSDEDPVWTPCAKDGDGSDDERRGRKGRGKFNVSAFPGMGRSNLGGPGRPPAKQRPAKRSYDSGDSQDSNVSNKQPTRVDPTATARPPSVDNTNGGYQKGEYILEYNEISGTKTLWRVDRGNLLQKFEAVQREGKTMYKTSNTYSSFQALNKNKLQAVKNMRTVEEVKGNLVVEILTEPVQSQTGVQQTSPLQQLQVNNQRQNAPPQLRGLENSQHKEAFEVFVQTLVSQALDPNFIMEITKENDEYFVNSLREIQSANDAFKNRLAVATVAKWSELLRLCVQYLPCVNVGQVRPGTINCQSCRIPAMTRMIQFHGQPYDMETLHSTANAPVTSQQGMQGFTVCSPCVEVIEHYSKLHHSKHDLYGKCVAKVNEIRNRDVTKESHEILEECLQDITWISVLFSYLESMWMRTNNIPSTV